MFNHSVSRKWPIGDGVRLALLSFIVYYLTCHPTITWWTNSSLSLAASTLGVTHPPGALLQTISGWLVTRLAPAGSEAYLLNIFTAALAAVTAGMVVVIGAGLLRRWESTDGKSVSPITASAAVLGVVVGALTLAFGQTFWLYAVKFTPYMMTALFTALLIWAMIRWWERAGSGHDIKWLILIAFLFGLDVSVHRTNLLLAPGFIIWVLLGHPKTVLSPKAWIGGVCGLAAGLSFHLLLIPMAAAEPFMNSGDPSTLSGWWDYVSLKQFGGGFLIGLWPRKAAFFGGQVSDYIKAFGLNFMQWGGKISPWGILPVILGLFGLFRLWIKNSRLAVGLLILFLTASLGAVVYFNVPENFIRMMYRHYLPSFVIFAVWIGYGAGSMILILPQYFRRHRWLIFAPAAALLILLPGGQLLSNYSTCDVSQRYFARDYAVNYLTTLEQNAILFTYGDNDTHPLWYLQAVEGIRTDVTVLNINLLNVPWYVEQILAREPNLPLTLTPEQAAKINAKPWTDTLIALPVIGEAADFHLPDQAVLPDSLHLQVPPGLADQYLLAHDWLLLQMLEENNWKRPIYFSSGGWGRIPEWITPYLRREGLVFRLIPTESPPVNAEILFTNLVETYSYRGFADAGVPLDDVSRRTGLMYLRMIMQLAGLASESGNDAVLTGVKNRLRSDFAVDRLGPLDPGMEQYLEALLGENSGKSEKQNDNNEEQNSS